MAGYGQEGHAGLLGFDKSSRPDGSFARVDHLVHRRDGWINIVTPALLLHFPRATGMGVGVLYWIEMNEYFDAIFLPMHAGDGCLHRACGSAPAAVGTTDHEYIFLSGAFSTTLQLLL
jgi:hypothetical protein